MIKCKEYKVLCDRIGTSLLGEEEPLQYFN